MWPVRHCSASFVQLMTVLAYLPNSLWNLAIWPTEGSHLISSKQSIHVCDSTSSSSSIMTLARGNFQDSVSLKITASQRMER